MASTGIRNIDNSMQKTNELLHKIDEKIGWKDMDKTYSATRAVLQATRDRLQPDEVADFASQLPMIMTGMVYEGYKPSDKPLQMKREGYLAKISELMTDQADDPEKIVHAVMSTISDKVSPGEMNHIIANMPKDMQLMMAASMAE